MRYLKTVLQFGWPYLRRYWVRLSTGILLGFLFALSQASFVWTIKTLLDRLEPPSAKKEATTRTNAFAFSVGDLANLPLLVDELKSQKRAPDRYLADNLSDATKQALTTYQGAGSDSTALEAVFVKDLNRIVQGPTIYDAQRFSGVILRSKTQQHLALSQDPQGKDLLQLNRLLLEDAYPLELSRNSFLRQLTKDWNAKAVQTVDPWMPMVGRPIDWQQMVGGLLFLPLLMLVRGMLGYLNTYCMCWVNERVINDLRLDVLTKLNSLSLDYFNRSTTGDLITRINSDTSTLHRCLSLGFSDLTREPITIVVLLVAAAMVDFKLTLVAFVFLPLCVIPIQILGRKVRRVTQAAIATSVKQSSQIIEGIAGIRVVKAFGLEGQRIESYRQQCQQLLHHAMKTVQARELVNPIMETISMLGLGLLIVYIFYSQTSIPDLVAFVTGVVLCFAPIKKLAGLHVMFQQASVGVERLMQVMNEQPSVKESPQAFALPEFTTALTFEDVSFSYGNQTVIHNLNLSVPRGFKLGVAGESGSGKSTLVNLIFRFYDPTDGAVKIDGHNLRDVSVRDLRVRMALVSQEVVLFDQTVAQNIACGKLGATRAEVEDAARHAYAHEFILQLPQGYDTRVGERGVTLSGGQRQRIAIARAFIRNAPILVLDEATASLDSQSEAEVQVAIDRLAENRTVVCVAHRLSTLATTDQVIVLSQGRIIEQGRYADLLRANGPFAAMASRQGISVAR